MLPILQRARSAGARVNQARQGHFKFLALDVNAAGLAIAVSTRPVIPRGPITAISMTLKSTHYLFATFLSAMLTIWTRRFSGANGSLVFFSIVFPYPTASRVSGGILY